MYYKTTLNLLHATLDRCLGSEPYKFEHIERLDLWRCSALNALLSDKFWDTGDHHSKQKHSP